MTDYEMMKALYDKLALLGHKESWGMPDGPRTEYSKYTDKYTCTEAEFGSAVDLRTNGLIFDKDGSLIGHWADYD